MMANERERCVQKKKTKEKKLRKGRAFPIPTTLVRKKDRETLVTLMKKRR
jgi:hypothetical protein